MGPNNSKGVYGNLGGAMMENGLIMQNAMMGGGTPAKEEKGFMDRFMNFGMGSGSPSNTPPPVADMTITGEGT